MKKGLLLISLFYIPFCVFAQQDAWIYFLDKENVSEAIANPITILTQKAIDRKQAHQVVIDARDVPVNETYISQIKIVPGITVMAKSKWFNAIHVRGSESDIKELINFGFVAQIDFADKSLNLSKFSSQQKKQEKLENTLTMFNYGNALNQIEMFKGDALHLAGYSGTGMTVAVIDAGFPNVNTMASFQKLRDDGNLLGSYDFVHRDSNVFTGTSSNHGTWVLSNMAGYIENEFIGTAPDASYYLFVTEDALTENPVEESYWVEAVERADSLGVNIINTSLGYTTYDNPNYSYDPSDMDGNTAYITKGANIAFEKGMLLVNSAGNSGNDSWQIVGAPADARGVLSIGAVDANGHYATFSSKGNAVQPTQKPDVVAQGQASYVITENDVIVSANGTSFSSPILAGGIVCLWQALPDKTNAEIMQLVRESASQYKSPDYFLGYGIPDLQAALVMGEVLMGKSDEIQLFPNPTTGMLYFNRASDDESIWTIRLFDVLGREVKMALLSIGNNVMDISSLSNGMYLIKIDSNNTSNTIKVLKK
ncbi:serine protease [Pseudalgibacter alginicilyticus]|uniref:Serine protease n=1 Tax=Pseudalgibacter alginicilyticus TaxID=1736674 RepID=A0A0P0CVJ1_9FLAO|nr:S8 family serine peptidase [Pseudalgibacter alginicilyticus]ALJ04419.1 serine protease [Pseudalgibacter alginicilyticus]